MSEEGETTLEDVEQEPVSRVLQDIGGKFSKAELQAILKGRGLGTTLPLKFVVPFDGEVIKFGFITDTHIGGETYQPKLWDQTLRHFDQARVQFIVHAGDVTAGMCDSIEGYIYELTHLGSDAQRAYAIQELSRWQGKMYLIDGNHDRWFYKSSGTIIVKDIAEGLPDGEFLGHDEGELRVGHVTLRLFHGEDGSSYATSYRVQKLIEAMTGGEKPHVLLVGHTHKQGYFFERNIHAVTGGALTLQSRYMRAKRRANHTGANICEIVQNEHGVVRFTYTFIPFYV